VTLANRCGRLLDVGTGEVGVDRVLHVGDDGRIEAVGGAGDGIADGATVVDLGELSVLPGLIDVHTHLIGDVQTAGVPSTVTSAAEEALIGVGSLGVGRFADLVAVAGNPLDDVTQLERPVVVAKGGSVVVDRRIGAGAA
jgi:imidazolonepropionase-like amidohydrolase